MLAGSAFVNPEETAISGLRSPCSWTKATSQDSRLLSGRMKQATEALAATWMRSVALCQRCRRPEWDRSICSTCRPHLHPVQGTQHGQDDALHLFKACIGATCCTPCSLAPTLEVLARSRQWQYFGKKSLAGQPEGRLQGTYGSVQRSHRPHRPV